MDEQSTSYVKISSYLDELLAAHLTCENKPGLRFLFRGVVMPHLLRADRHDPDFTCEAHKDELITIRNWMGWAINNTSRWIYNEVCPEPQAPTLREQPTLQAVFKIAADEFHAVMEVERKFWSLYYDKPDIKTVYRWNNGYRIVRVRTPNGLRRTGALLRNCMLRGEYDHLIQIPGRHVFSLRDSDNMPRVDFDVQDKHLMQCRGINNTPPALKYFSYIRDFCRYRRLTLSNPGLTGMVHWNEAYHSVYDLPRHVLIEGNVDLTRVQSKVIFPKDSKITGHLYLNGKGPHVDFNQCDVNLVVYQYLNKNHRLHREDGPAEIYYHKPTRKIIGEGWFHHGKEIKNPIPSPSCTAAAAHGPARNPSPGSL